MIDFKYVYILKRIGDKKAKLLYKRKFLKAEKIEENLHELFSDARFTLKKNIPNKWWFQNHIKIGFSKNPEKRLFFINKDIFKEGNTEWFSLNPVELFVLICWLYWYSIRWYLFTLITFILIFYIFY